MHVRSAFVVATGQLARHSWIICNSRDMALAPAFGCADQICHKRSRNYRNLEVWSLLISFCKARQILLYSYGYLLPHRPDQISVKGGLNKRKGHSGPDIISVKRLCGGLNKRKGENLTRMRGRPNKREEIRVAPSCLVALAPGLMMTCECGPGPWAWDRRELGS